MHKKKHMGYCIKLPEIKNRCLLKLSALKAQRYVNKACWVCIWVKWAFLFSCICAVVAYIWPHESVHMCICFFFFFFWFLCLRPFHDYYFPFWNGHPIFSVQISCKHYFHWRDTKGHLTCTVLVYFITNLKDIALKLASGCGGLLFSETYVLPVF